MKNGVRINFNVVCNLSGAVAPLKKGFSDFNLNFNLMWMQHRLMFMNFSLFIATMNV